MSDLAFDCGGFNLIRCDWRELR